VELPSSSAEYLQNPRPEYPRVSRLRGEQGRVVVHVLIGIDGRAQKAEILNSSGFQRLDQVALTTVLAWRYVPGKRAGVPEAMWFSVPLNFVLDL
jgi:protein TonB